MSAHARLTQFREHVIETLRDRTPLADILDPLVEEAVEMGIGKAEAVDIIEQLYGEVQTEALAGLRIWYDTDRSGAGVASGNTILTFRVTNASKKAIQSVLVTVQHPQTHELLTLPPVTTLNKGATKFTEADLVFERMGRHSIRNGIGISIGAGRLSVEYTTRRPLGRPA